MRTLLAVIGAASVLALASSTHAGCYMAIGTGATLIKGTVYDSAGNETDAKCHFLFLSTSPATGPARRELRLGGVANPDCNPLVDAFGLDAEVSFTGTEVNVVRHGTPRGRCVFRSDTYVGPAGTNASMHSIKRFRGGDVLDEPIVETGVFTATGLSGQVFIGKFKTKFR